VGELNQKSQELFSSFEILKRQIDSRTSILLRALLRRFVIVIVIIFGITLYSSIVISKKVTQPIIALSDYTTRFVKNGFNPTGRFPVATKNDEVGLLISNFKILRNEIVELIRNFQEKVEKRTHALNCQKLEIEAQKEEIEAQRDELSRKNKLIESQRDLVLNQNRSIIDSLIFAKKIQDSLLPDTSYIQNKFPNSFIINFPKDIVSGDFYWIHEVNHRKQKVILFALADCTGHGVPGAFMSIVGHNGLNQAVKEYKLVSPSSILNFLNTYISETLHHERVSDQVKNGMDIGIIAYYTEDKKIDYAGALLNLIHIHDGILGEIPGDKIFMGRNDISTQDSSNFSNKSIPINSGDLIVLTSDGFVDQFGGPNFTKFKKRQFRQLLTDISYLPTADDMRSKIMTTLENWKGTCKQTDDILVFGTRFNF
jgi:serine phosphatase RsbU (regulator of sigma subunit)